MYAKKNNGKKIIVILLAIVMLIGGTIGGTLAWLSATSGAVTNTFTVGDVNIELKEHYLKADGRTLDTSSEVTEENTYKIVPGDTQPKDPFVRVEKDSEDSWIFVQVKEVRNDVTGNANATKYVTWEIADGWKKLGATTNGVSTYYRTTNYTTSSTDTTYYVLKGGSNENTSGIVSYDSDLTKANIEALDADKDGSVANTEMPQLIFKAFAVQAEAAGTYTDVTTGATAAWNQIAEADKLSSVSDS